MRQAGRWALSGAHRCEAGYILCAGVFQEDGMVAILAFLWI